LSRQCEAPTDLWFIRVEKRLMEPFRCNLLLKPAANYNISLLVDLLDKLVSIRIRRLPPPGVFAHVVDGQFNQKFRFSAVAAAAL
jgi:hypothetical protein